MPDASTRHSVTITGPQGDQWGWHDVSVGQATEIWDLLGKPDATVGFGAGETAQPGHGELQPSEEV